VPYCQKYTPAVCFFGNFATGTKLQVETLHLETGWDLIISCLRALHFFIQQEQILRTWLRLSKKLKNNSRLQATKNIYYDIWKKIFEKIVA